MDDGIPNAEVDLEEKKHISVMQEMLALFRCVSEFLRFADEDCIYSRRFLQMLTLMHNETFPINNIYKYKSNAVFFAGWTILNHWPKALPW